MRLLSIALLLAGSIATRAAVPLRVTVQSATLISGPGKEPPLGSAPYEPRIQAQTTVKGLKPGSTPTFHLWRATEAAVKTLPAGRLIRSGTAGITRLEGTVQPLDSQGSFRVVARAGSPLAPQECLVVEVLLRERWAGRGVAPLMELDLPRHSRPAEPVAQP